MPTITLSKGFRLTVLARGILLLMPAIAVLLMWSIPASQVANGAGTAEPPTEVQLIMVEDPGCPYCAQWHKEVGISYAATAEGRFAPLVRRPRNHPDVAKFENIVYSPTFIVARNGVEIGRIVGYPGADFFWGFLANILKKSGFNAHAGAF